MNVVLDANAAIEIALNRKHAVDFTRLLDQTESALAPDLYISEVANSLWKEHHLGGYDLENSKIAIETALDLIDEFVPSSSLYKEAFQLSCALGHSVYDMFYLALAERRGAILITLDAKLRRTAARRGVRTQ